jgi:Sap-like sulfolipid-1-addressing protein
VAEGVGEILTYAIGVAISPFPIIAVILMLCSARARINGPMFLAGWVVALGVVSVVAYTLADAGDDATDETTGDTVSWAQIAVGVSFLLIAARQWRSRPAPGAEPRCRSGCPPLLAIIRREPHDGVYEPSGCGHGRSGRGTQAMGQGHRRASPPGQAAHP